MPKTKLTLSIDPAVIAHAKAWTSRHDTTVSELVERFLADLGEGGDGVAPVSERLRGLLPPSASTRDYVAHLAAKHR